MTLNDLDTPLGQDKDGASAAKGGPARKSARFPLSLIKRDWKHTRLPFTVSQAIAAFFGLFLIAFIGFAALSNDPFGGEPMVQLKIDRSKLADTKDAQPHPAGPVIVRGGQTQSAGHDGAAPGMNPGAHGAATAPQPGQKTITVIDGLTGQRQDVVVANAPASGDAKGLSETSRYGAIPLAVNGKTPMDAYAAPADPKAATMPAIALVVTGLGLGTSRTMDAIERLPPAVTLAFSPYGANVADQVARARAQGREIVLQLPMEPFEYPDNDPGPQTLLSTLPPEQNIDRLHWLLSRFSSYVGVMNYMGARFTSLDTALSPVMKDIAKRGLLYFDDGGNTRSIAASQAQAQSIPFASARLAIDTVPTPAEIDKMLAQLESDARARGVAIGTASALPVALARIDAWQKTLAGKGIALVPLTAAVKKAK